MYYAISGSFSNAMVVWGFRSHDERKKWLAARRDNSTYQSHYEHSAMAATRREAEALCARNRVRARAHEENSGQDGNYGSTQLPTVED